MAGLQIPCSNVDKLFSSETRAAIIRDPVAIRNDLNSESAKLALTLLVTTSAVPVNPETAFIEQVMQSYITHEPMLRFCRKIVVCDKEVLKERDNFRIGKVTEKSSRDYGEYKRRLHKLCKDGENDEYHPFYNAEILELEERHGFGPAVRRALELVATPYVIVIQHDRRAVQPFSLKDILQGLESYSMQHVNYICLGTRATWNNGSRALTEFQFDVRDHKIELAPGSDSFLVPVPFWYDSTHICRTSFYRNMALRPHVVSENPLTRWRWKTGEFIEDKLGQILRRQLKEYGLPALFRFGSFLLINKFDQSMEYTSSGNCSMKNQDFYEKNFFFKDSEFEEKKGPDSAMYYEGAEASSAALQWSRRRRCHVIVVHLNQRKVQTLSKIIDGVTLTDVVEMEKASKQ